MTLDDLGNLGEFLAAIGTLITLVYLAVQIRQNTNVVRGATYQQVATAFTSVVGDIYRDPELARIFTAGSDGLRSLSKEDRARFHYLTINLFRTFENLHHQYRKTLIDYEDWEGHREGFLRFLSREEMQGWWRENSFRFNRYFRAFIDEQLRVHAA